VLLLLTAAPPDGLSKTTIANGLDLPASTLTAVIGHLRGIGHLEQVGERRGAKYRLSESGKLAIESEEEMS
jgi:predicted transcriptional regulator